MKLKDKKIIIGAALAGAGILISEIKNRRKLDQLTQRINHTEDCLENLEEKTWSLNRSMKEIAKAHNSLIKMRIDDYEDFDERFYEIEDEITTVYSHIEELNRLKKNKKGGIKDSIIPSDKLDELEDSTGENEEE